MELHDQMKKEEQSFEATGDYRYRNVLLKILQHPPKNITIGDWDGEGDITFSVPMTDIGLSHLDYRIHEDEIFSYFVLDFVGELIIRENLALFVDKLKGYDINDYMIAIEDGVCHERFGAKTANGKLVFMFHVSLLSHILTDNIRETLG